MKRLPLGLALSGGTAKAVAHVGVLKALVEAGISVDFISGTSGGSIVAGLYASGMPMATMESIAKSMSWLKLASIKLSRLGFMSSQRIEEFMKELTGDINFSECKIPFFVVATDLLTGEKYVFKSGNLALAVRASCSIPQIYLPVEINGRYYVDGGLSEYLPVETLEEQGDLFVIGAHLAPMSENYERPRHILQLIMQITALMARKNYLVSAQRADFLIRPDLDGFSAFDFNNSERLIEIGYQLTRELIPSIDAMWKRRSRLWRRLLSRRPSK